MHAEKMPSILVVDDEPDNFDVIEALLNGEEYDFYYAPGGQQALSQLTHFQPDVILLDVMMPDMDGMEVCRHLKRMPEWSTIPVIMVTALTAKEDLAKCMAAGADDFISKPVSRIELRARVKSMLRIRRQYQTLSDFNRQLESTVQQRTSELYQRIFQDPLTQLPSRAFLLQHLQTVLQDHHHEFALVYLGCDQFKLINGSLGHDIGEQLLVEIAKRLNTHLRPGDLLTRTGEDEFCFFLDQVSDQGSVSLFVQKILQDFDEAFAVAGFEIYVTACIGVALSSDGYTQSHEPLQDADTAMYQARLRGKGRYQVFDRQMHQRFMERLTLENDLRRALERQEFVNFYQPIVNLRTGQITGFEALVRWLHPELGMVSPGRFIPCMEETGLIVPVGMMVLQLACQQLNQWNQAGWSDLTISVNLSVRQFAHPNLITEIDQVVTETHINPELLRLEITESAIMEDAKAAVDVTQELRSRRMQLSIDDFGTGYSSLGYLNQFPIDSLKIDRAFVKEIGTPNNKSEILQAIIGLGEALNLNLIAEGIETPQQLAHLQALGIQYGQGYFFGKPLNSKKATALLQTAPK
ncbi:MAG: EAL domain-containing protein [Leptolyngbya sp. SIO1E4]|nr:EAL domain-containing protein [Leptolyngbya sp. SIO1E4]